MSGQICKCSLEVQQKYHSSIRNTFNRVVVHIAGRGGGVPRGGGRGGSQRGGYSGGPPFVFGGPSRGGYSGGPTLRGRGAAAVAAFSRGGGGRGGGGRGRGGRGRGGQGGFGGAGGFPYFFPSPAGYVPPGMRGRGASAYGVRGRGGRGGGRGGFAFAPSMGYPPFPSNHSPPGSDDDDDEMAAANDIAQIMGHMPPLPMGPAKLSSYAGYESSTGFFSLFHLFMTPRD